VNYNDLYKIQDKILEIVFSLKNPFYLTGGTAIHRFYYQYRYSDDIDLFCDDNTNFYIYFRELLNVFKQQNVNYELIVDAADFKRIIIDHILQVDFVNDRNYRYGTYNTIHRYRIDNIKNILSNKITAVISRDNPKDIFDIFVICMHEKFYWREIIEISLKKSYFDLEYLIYRIETFPLIWLQKLKIIKKIDIQLKRLVDDITKLGENSFYLD
jgi:predicted nucleotidyltransferase component of viral defense system